MSPTPDTKTPSKRWRVITSAGPQDYSSERKAYDAINAIAAIGTAALGVKVEIHHWENSRWALYERAVVTENGWGTGMTTSDTKPGGRPMTALPSPADHAEMPKRMVGRRLVRTCSCGKPWPCEQARWNRLRAEVEGERDTRRQLAASRNEEGRESQAERLTKYADALDYVLAAMDRMEAGR